MELIKNWAINNKLSKLNQMIIQLKNCKSITKMDKMIKMQKCNLRFHKTTN